MSMDTELFEKEFAVVLVDESADPIIGYKSGYLTVTKRVDNTHLLVHCNRCGKDIIKLERELVRSDARAPSKKPIAEYIISSYNI